ncbi:hypothetical protein N7452_003578 [Penicillium brevicompactum]|uniref:Zn(2)-C6 fungal-type domain-containing protein n=1 Tax=Penicillium brevicompactum TaxID=5074 RepID=A0A9W9QU61_PENBR|nr:hypothetical protein N7452_003578 [Penicillium brevicompactum]
MADKGKRSKHAKVRTGCITCKIRHKKCDEAEPACKNCTSTGRTCDGYAQAPDKRTRPWRQSRDGHQCTPAKCEFTLILRDSSQVGLSWNERAHLDFFRRCTTLQCSEYFEDEFWSRLVLQMCEGQAAVRHAAIAMGARQRQYEAVETESVKDRESLLALSHAHKSITCLSQDLVRQESSRSHKETVLVSCIILTMLTLFQEDYFAARCHLQSGYQLFRDWMAIDSETSPNKEILEQAFSQLHLHFSTCVNPREFVNDQRLVPPTLPKFNAMTPSGDLDLTRESRGLMVIGWQIVQSHLSGGFSIGNASSPIRRGGVAVLSKMRLWRSQLKLSSVSGLPSQRHYDMLSLLEMWTLVLDVKMAVANSPEPSESLYDDYLPSFQRAVQLAQGLLRLEKSEVEAPVYYITPSVVTALLWCGTKCRDWKVRHDIVSLLSGCKHQSLWASIATSCIEKLIHIESNGITQGACVPEPARVQSVTAKPLTSSIVQLWYQKPQSELDGEHSMWRCETLAC